MKCPHCQTSFHDAPDLFRIGKDANGPWGLVQQNCPACSRLILEFIRAQFANQLGNGRYYANAREERFIYPRSVIRPNPPAEVPAPFRDDYIEAALVLADSPKASAALSRRCLQHVLREKARVKRQDLAKEIQEVIDSGKLPSHLAESIDAIRNIGNFAAHPIKSTSTGEIVDVVPGEADWNLDVLDGLFDFYFVQPAILAKKRDALNTKLASAGKPPVK
jgi:hypothetical protein